MAKSLFIRVAGALGVFTLSLFIVGIVPFFSANPTAGAGLSEQSNVIVNREFKGDRLPFSFAVNSTMRNAPSARQNMQKPTEIPLGCDPAFSPVSSPRLAYFYGRCIT